MDSVLLTKLAKVIGENWFENKYVIEALSDYREINKPLANVGDSILNFTVKNISYRKKPDPAFIDKMRQAYSTNTANQKIYNNDEACQKYLLDKGLSYAPPGFVSEDKADRIIEGMIGAVFYVEGWETALSFTEDVLRLHEGFNNEFPI
jgi:dsRNA-specific ribonuclease